ncbi:MAG: Gfo/Idh/MocA family oxidoreductase, partial [bacterium]|nr:Gfo/Idh/MocA family oxidoreductase [bacterium]
MSHQKAITADPGCDVFCVGLGKQFTTWHCRVLEDSDGRFRARAICDLDDARFPAALGRLGGGTKVSTFRCFEELLDFAAKTSRREVRPAVFIISTPPEYHFEQALRCLAAGFHVYIDKPPTLEATSTRALVSLAAEKELRIVVGAQRRFESVFQRFREAAAGVGAVHRLHVHAHGNFSPVEPYHRENAVIPIGTGYHVIDTLTWLVEELGGELASGRVVAATLRRYRDNPSQYAAFEALLRFDFGEKTVPVTT